MKQPFVTLIIPCRNEERYVWQCLDTILKNDYPKDRLEILIFDGMSTDQTRSTLNFYSGRNSQIKVFDNPGLIVSTGMNLGFEQARGTVVFKIDAHASYPPNYISQCVQALWETGAQNVGGKFNICPGKNSLVAKAIALVVANPFGVGSYYQWMMSREQITEVDTVSFGCYDKSFLDRHHLRYNENVLRGADSEFNARVRKAGGKILLIPNILFDYYARTSLKAAWKHQFDCGFWNIYGVQSGTQLTFRAFLPLLVTVSGAVMALASLWVQPLAWILAGLLLGYVVMALRYSIVPAWKTKNPGLATVLPAVFLTYHTGFAAGSSYAALRRLWYKFKIARPRTESSPAGRAHSLK